MAQELKIRFGWIRFMYCYTLIGAGLSGLGVIVVPEKMIALNKFAPQDPMIFGIVGSVWLAFGILSIFGLFYPLKFIPVLLMQLFYKSFWIIGVVLPIWAKGEFSANDMVFAAGMATFIVGDLIAIPFSYVFSKKIGLPDTPFRH